MKLVFMKAVSNRNQEQKLSVYSQAGNNNVPAALSIRLLFSVVPNQQLLILLGADFAKQGEELFSSYGLRY